MIPSERSRKVKSIVQMLKDQGAPAKQDAVMGFPIEDEEQKVSEPDASGVVESTPETLLTDLLSGNKATRPGEQSLPARKKKKPAVEPV